MGWSDTAEIQNRLDGALNQYQWTAAAETCSELIRRLYEEASPYPEPAARQLLAALRKKRQFGLVARVAEAFMRTGQIAPRVRRQYAQALIDQGILLGAEPVLHGLTMEPLGGDSEAPEAHGLLGRVYKQLYVNADAPSNPYVRSFFERALSEYLQVYRRDPKRFAWHGVNAVALVRRAEADGIDLTHAPAADQMARALLTSLPEPAKVVEAFELATRLEALVALKQEREAAIAAVDYVSHPDADAFEIGSTLRQLEQVWRLTPDAPPGSTILPLLRAALLRREGGMVQTGPGGVQREIAVVKQAVNQLEKVFGDDRTVTLQWFQLGLERAMSVARVERLDGKGHGTGWLVQSSDFFPPASFPDGPRLLLLTNAHVINQEGTGGALSPDDARANFQALHQTCEFAPKVVWSSPPDALDATFLEFRGTPPTAKPLPLFEKTVRLTEPPSRMYIIGHPGGSDLQLSLHDNLLLGCNDRLLHYRTPTEGGSSGSPVFESQAWRVVGLHHAGGTLERLDGTKPDYEANEGISIRAIKAALAAGAAHV